MAWGGGNANSVDAWVKRLKENDTSFTSLHILSFRRVTAAELTKVFDALATNHTLKELYASGHGLNNESAQSLANALKENKTLERLNIGHDGMGSDEAVVKIFAEGLMANQGLIRLDLENKGLGGHGESVASLAKALEQGATGLQEINLARNKLTDKEVSTLCRALTHNRTLQKLDLCLNSFTFEGTKAIAAYLASQDQDQGGLKEIDLSDNDITVEGGIAIGKALESNKSLHRLRMSSAMDPPLPLEEGDEDKIPWDENVQQLNQKLQPDQEQEIQSDGDEVLETIAQSLRTNQTLQELWMDYCNVSAVGAGFLAEALRHNHGLTTVRMRNNRVGNRGARALGAALTPTAGSATGHNTTLLALELGANKIGVLGWHGLVGANSLESLGLYDNQIHVLHEALELQHAAGSTLTPTSPVPSTDPPTLSNAVPNGASQTGTRALEKLLHLDVGCNSISREHFTQLGVSLIKGLLPALIRLEIAGNGDRTEAPESGDGSGGGEDDPDQEEQNAWERVASRIEEARPALAIHWKGALGQGRE